MELRSVYLAAQPLSPNLPVLLYSAAAVDALVKQGVRDLRMSSADVLNIQIMPPTENNGIWGVWLFCKVY
jgi:hypothetical protein